MAKDRAHSIYEFDEFRLDEGKLMLYRSGREIHLPPKAIETLAVLVRGRGEIVSKDDLIDAVWTDSIVEESNLSQYLYLLRKTLGNRPDGSPYIETLRRRGYRFTGDVRLVNGLVERAVQPAKALPVEVSIQRAGNVLRLVEWPSSEFAPAADALTEPATITSDEPRGRNSPTGWLAISIGVIGFALLAFTISWFLPRTPSSLNAGNADLNIIRLTNENYVHDATISRDGNYFAYSEPAEGTSRIWIQQTGQSGRVEVVPAGNRAHCCKTFSPDGKFLYFLAWSEGEKPALFRVPTLGGVPEKVLGDVNSWVSFSPDGNEMAFLRREGSPESTSIMIAPSNGKGTQRRVLGTESGLHIFAPPAWSPDAAKLVFSGTDSDGPSSRLYTLDLKSGTTSAISKEVWSNCFRIVWLPDGSAFAMIGTKEGETLSTRRDQVYLISYPSGRSRRLTTDGSRHEPESLGVTDNGAIIAVSYNRASQIWSIDAGGDSRSAVQLTTGVGEGRGGMAAMPDGRIGYTILGEHGVSLWTVAADGSGKRLLHPESKAEMLSSTPDGKYFVFRDKLGTNYHLYRVSPSGGEPVALTSDESDSSEKGYTSTSPDSLWVAYDTMLIQKGTITRTIRKVPIEGGTPITLKDDSCGAPEYSPDGRYIACSYYDQNRFAVISADDGSPIATFEAAKFSPLEPKWAPDGRSLVYIVHRNSVCNLWKQPIDGGQPEPLTDFTSGQCHNFVYSRDGSRIYLARGYEARDAILISFNKK